MYKGKKKGRAYDVPPLPLLLLVLLYSLIHRSAWNWNSRKFISKILYIPAPVPPGNTCPGTLHSPVPIPLVIPMNRYARSWMFFVQTNVCTSERTSDVPSLMLQVAGRALQDAASEGQYPSRKVARPYAVQHLS